MYNDNWYKVNIYFRSKYVLKWNTNIMFIKYIHHCPSKLLAGSRIRPKRQISHKGGGLMGNVWKSLERKWYVNIYFWAHPPRTALKKNCLLDEIACTCNSTENCVCIQFWSWCNSLKMGVFMNAVLRVENSQRHWRQASGTKWMTLRNQSELASWRITILRQINSHG